jgi:hypothetical protein
MYNHQSRIEKRMENNILVSYAPMLSFPVTTLRARSPRAQTGSGNANDVVSGALANGTTFGAGKVGHTFSSDGVDDRVIIPGFLTNVPSTEITVEFWHTIRTTKMNARFLKRTSVNPRALTVITNE